MDKPTVAIFSDSNFFSIHLVENLLSRSCKVVVFVADKKDWMERTRHITNRANLQILDEKNFQVSQAPTYAIFCFGFAKEQGSYTKFKFLYSIKMFRNIKSIAIFPAEAFDSRENDSLPLNSNLSIVYLCNLLGSRVDVAGGLRMSRLLSEVIESGSMTVGVGEVFYPTFAPAIAKQICKWIFSFGPYGKEIFVTGTEVSAADFWRQVAKFFPYVKLFYNKNIHPLMIPRGLLRENLDSNLTFLLRETFQGIVKITKKEKHQTRLSSPKFIKPLIAVFIFLLILPTLSILISGTLLFASYKSYMAGRIELSRNLMSVSKISSKVGIGYGLNVAGKIADVGLAAIDAVEVSKKLTGKILGDEIYDPANITGKLKSTLEYIYQSISVIEVETKNKAGKGNFVAKKILDKVDFEKIKKVSFAGSKLSEELPEILGKDKRQTYLILFQNNMEIRPTGGFIGSFAIVTFEGGRMTDFSVSDVYSADGQLKGHIEPPEPIRKYLGEANWFLRDSNWDPDFPTSAKRAEWFIDKEIGRTVEGVIAIDLSPVKDALSYMGPIYLSDYNMDITAENLYEKTQEEVQEGFFPGTHKKASFLTALSRNMVAGLANLDGAGKAGVLKTFYENLDARHVQFYLHNEKAQNLISGLGWSGEVALGNCGENCYSDFLALAEANVGVNKANYFISRDLNLRIDTSNNRIERTLIIDFKNSANPNLGAPANYKSYIRVLVPRDAQVQGNYEITETRGIKEIGLLVEVLAGQSREAIVSWISPTADGDYALYVRKQAGTNETGKLSVAINGNLVYNSDLTRDLWIQKP